MATARFRIDPGLSAFLAPARRSAPFEYACARAATLKNALEALGIPHTEVARVRVNGAEATLDRIVRDADEVEVRGWASEGSVQWAPRLAFVADAHLGALARFLRMLGFDTVHDNRLADETIRTLAAESARIVLTRDRELLKCREIAVGAYVRALAPAAQLSETAARFGLAAHARPFTLCLCCNVAIAPVPKRAVLDRLPEQVARVQEAFYRCPRCNRIYWPGSHYARMREVLARMIEGVQLPSPPGFPPARE
jgi:uncharacterized protein with PIN domain